MKALSRFSLMVWNMKPNLHPLYRKLTASCACGAKFETRSTAAAINVEVCSVCHPYFTGRQRWVDTAGRGAEVAAANKE